MASPDVSNKLIAWILTGAGTLLAYSAYKRRNPWDVLRDIEGTPLPTATGETAAIDTNPLSSMLRLRMLADRSIPPELVSIQPCGQLDKEAAASKRRIDSKLGFVVKLTSCQDAYRPYDVQAAGYARDPRRFADPRKGLHVVGLAFDIHKDHNTAEVWSAFRSEGWHQSRPLDEPWHWSYGIRG